MKLRQTRRTKFLRTEVLRDLVLRTNLRDNEHEAALTIPPIVGVVEVRVEPPTTAEAERVEKERTAVRIFDGFVHYHDPNQAHGFDVFIREVLANETGDLGVRCRELPLCRHFADVLGVAVIVLEEHALEDSDLVRHTLGRLEVWTAEHALGVVRQTETLLLKTLDPVLTGRAVRGDREVDDTIFLAPRTGRFGNHQLTRQKALHAVHSTEFVHEGFHLSECEFAVLHNYSPLSCSLSGFLTARELRDYDLSGYSQKDSYLQDFLAVTTSK